MALWPGPPKHTKCRTTGWSCPSTLHSHPDSPGGDVGDRRSDGVSQELLCSHPIHTGQDIAQLHPRIGEAQSHSVAHPRGPSGHNQLRIDVLQRRKKGGGLFARTAVLDLYGAHQICLLMARRLLCTILERLIISNRRKLSKVPSVRAHVTDDKQ
jgi:hypothetical protein